ncbi:hypothetical protein F0225_17980 [Vibrio pectenicida]|uniref:DUF3330 domain-containing protein n=1 Tax=Vibrio pectenicida TaxID=62763 RepID=A0A427U4P5_9VIBR|nr:hypothetical protein [Vibrio pectenicida]NOH73208.1 hypothetical protein [Vibrio pectenicida]RSD31697.1 hypothetical protein EJA03_07650 [Vibrio pectenicida]
MFTIEGVCDWCKKLSLVAKHEYIDGLCHQSCAECNDIAKLDVRQFNADERQQQAKNIQP